MAEIALEPEELGAVRKGGFLGHPVGLGYLAFTEAWERFSYYGMQALLVLYMVGQLLHPGHIEHVIGFGLVKGPLEAAFGPLALQALASLIFGLYTFSVYITPVFGGFIGDLVGRRGAVTAGAISMAMGHFMMAFDATFLFALLALIIGCGLLKGNLASQVGGLYGEDDPRRSDAFQIYTLAVNAGVIAAPLVCGTLGQLVGWHYGFAAAGVGMLIALVIYLAGYKHLPPDKPKAKDPAAPPAPPLTKHDWLAIVALVALLPVLAVAFVANNQIFNAYMVWAQDNVDLTLFGFAMPVTWIQSYDAGVSVATLVIAVWVWRWLAAKKDFAPHELFKLAIGCAISIFGVLLLAIGAFVSQQTGHKVALGWLLAFHWVNDFGFANILPVGLALYSRAAPKQVNATMIGVFYLLFAGTNLMVGWIGALYSQMSHVDFWLLHAGLTAASTAAIVILYKPLKSVLEAHAPAAA